MLRYIMYGLFCNKCDFYKGLNGNIARMKDIYVNIDSILKYSLSCKCTGMVANLVYVIALMVYSLRYGNTEIVANVLYINFKQY